MKLRPNAAGAAVVAWGWVAGVAFAGRPWAAVVAFAAAA
jgi:hypothetical protein